MSDLGDYDAEVARRIVKSREHVDRVRTAEAELQKALLKVPASLRGEVTLAVFARITKATMWVQP